MTDSTPSEIDITAPLPDDAADELAYAYEQALLRESRKELLDRAEEWAALPTMPKRIRAVELRGHRPDAQLLVRFSRVGVSDAEETIVRDIWGDQLAGYNRELERYAPGTREPVIATIATLIDDVQST